MGKNGEEADLGQRRQLRDERQVISNCPSDTTAAHYPAFVSIP
jgi:hypothetical protein